MTQENKSARGFVVLGIARYVDKILAPEMRERVLAATPEVSKQRQGLKRTEWYPLSYAVDQCAAIAEQFSDPQRSYDEVKRCGHFIADDASATYLKLLMKVLTPKLFARQFPEVWKRYHDFGRLVTDMSRIDENYLIFTLPGYPYVTPMCHGWMEFVFDQLGKGDSLKVTTNHPLGAPTPEQVEYTLTWS